MNGGPGTTNEKNTAAAVIQCPKCGCQERDIARFCRRCHMTLRFRCPSCGNEQRQGGSCAKCGVNFQKYISAVVAQKRAEADVFHERIERRASFMKNILWAPLTGGLSLIRAWLVAKESVSGR
jgi:hypothetical protein